jgi:purine-nucleoside phosphorylase
VLNNIVDNNIFSKVEETVAYIQKRINNEPKIAIILGSGLGELGEEVKNPTIIEYKDLPNFPISEVEGHKNRLVFGNLENKDIVIMQGRFHYYEGYSQSEITFPVRVLKKLGVELLIVTNASGAINTNFSPGNLMIISDHINFSFSNPLIGKNDNRLGARFPDMTDAYTKKYREIAKQSAYNIGIPVKEGVYMMFSGPNYETPAEIRMARILGADAVGMSTVPEVIVASQSEMNVLGISCITNMAAGVCDKKLSHKEVIETTKKVKSNFIKLIKEILISLIE